MVVDDDDIDAVVAEGFDFVEGDGAAVDGDEEVGFGAFLHAAVDGGGGEAVAFGGAFGDEVPGFDAVGVEDTAHDGDGGDAIDVVVAEEEDFFFAVDGEEDALDGEVHFMDFERVGEVAEAWAEERFEVFSGGEAALADEVFEDWGERACGTDSLVLERFSTKYPFAGELRHPGGETRGKRVWHSSFQVAKAESVGIWESFGGWRKLGFPIWVPVA